MNHFLSVTSFERGKKHLDPVSLVLNSYLRRACRHALAGTMPSWKSSISAVRCVGIKLNFEQRGEEGRMKCLSLAICYRYTWFLHRVYYIGKYFIDQRGPGQMGLISLISKLSSDS